MTEVLFYHLKGQTLEQVLPALLQKSLERGWRVVVQGSSDERIDGLDALLWTWRDDAFLPHGTWREAEAAEALKAARAKFQPNDRVRVTRFDKPGRIVRLDIKRGLAVVSLGLGQWEVPLDEVFPLDETESR